MLTVWDPKVASKTFASSGFLAFPFPVAYNFSVAGAQTYNSPGKAEQLFNQNLNAPCSSASAPNLPEWNANPSITQIFAVLSVAFSEMKQSISRRICSTRDGCLGLVRILVVEPLTHSPEHASERSTPIRFTVMILLFRRPSSGRRQQY